MPKQQLDPVLGQPGKEAGIPADRNFQAPSLCLSTTGLSGQAELAEHPTFPEQALPTVARLIEALEKQGKGSHSISPQDVCGCTRTQSPILPMSQSSPHAPHAPHYLCSVGRVREPGDLSLWPLPSCWKEDLGLRTDPSLPVAPQVLTTRCFTDSPPACWGMLS